MLTVEALLQFAYLFWSQRLDQEFSFLTLWAQSVIDFYTQPATHCLKQNMFTGMSNFTGVSSGVK